MSATLDKKTLELFEEKLKSWEDELLSSHCDLESENASEIIDQANRASMLDIEAAKSEHHQRTLREIKYALNKIKNGTYGICEETGDEIEFERLKANPVARYSLEAQREIELERKRFSSNK
jgi:DnaK suppressor protein